jgi:murein DD-endopeptidase MepM/ murein hydrolase activator NlpD
VKGGKTLKELKNRLFIEMTKVISQIRQNSKSKLVLGVLIGVLLVAATLYGNIQRNSIYMVKVNNKEIGYINKKTTYNNVVDSIRKTDGKEPLKYIAIEKVKYEGKNFIKDSQIERIARQELNLKMPATAIYANGVEVARVYNTENLDKILEEVKKHYYPKVENGTFKVISSTIKEKITISSILANPGEVIDSHDAVEKIVNGRGAEKTYVVKQGDTIWDIALKNDVSVEEIKTANPKLNIDKIGIDDEIKLATNIPYVNVEIVADIDSTEQLPYETKKEVDNKLAKGVKKLKQAGKDGKIQVKKRVAILNNDVISEEVSDSKVLTAAVDEIIIEGKKVPIYVATGDFLRPSRGSLSSRFGSRWGRMHEGIDFAASTGSPIYAADSGKVTFAGTRSGYGLCVMINHGNGYQTLYGHASKLLVKAGQSVKKGERIANVGSTGRSTGPHLHFEVRKNGVPKNPLNYIN